MNLKWKKLVRRLRGCLKWSQFSLPMGFQRDTLFVECFWSRSKNSQHVFYRVKNDSATPRGFKPDKTLLLVFLNMYYLKDF